MQKRTKGIVAGVAGGALLIGAGGTFALWQSTGNIDGGKIDTGKMELEFGDQPDWFDVSSDRMSQFGASANDDLGDTLSDLNLTGFSAAEFFKNAGATYVADDAGAKLDLDAGDESFKIVPGDLIMAIVQDFAIPTEGDNMFYQVMLDVAAPEAADDADAEAVAALEASAEVLANSNLVVGFVDKNGDLLQFEKVIDEETSEEVWWRVESGGITGVAAGEAVSFDYKDFVLGTDDRDLPTSENPWAIIIGVELQADEDELQGSTLDLSAVAVTVNQMRYAEKNPAATPAATPSATPTA